MCVCVCVCVCRRLCTVQRKERVCVCARGVNIPECKLSSQKGMRVKGTIMRRKVHSPCFLREHPTKVGSSLPQWWASLVVGSEVKASACNVGDMGSIPGSGRCPGKGNGNRLQYSYLEDPMDGGAWGVHGVTKSRTRLSIFTSLILPQW